MRSSHNTSSPDGSRSHENTGRDHDMRVPNSTSAWTFNNSNGGRAATPNMGSAPGCHSPLGQPGVCDHMLAVKWAIIELEMQRSTGTLQICL
eukprot:1325274-Amphidinium_carterae.1